MSRLCLALLVLLTPDLAVPTATAGDGASDRRARAHRDTVVVEWNEVALEAVRRVRPGPPITARALAVVSTCVYDAWAAYDRKALATETGGTLRRPRHERTYRNKHEAVSVSAHMALVDLFPGERALFDEALREQGYEPGAPAGVESPADVARAACGAVLAFRHADGSNQLGDENNGAPYSDYTGYVPVNTVDVVTDPNRWQPITFSTGATPGFIAPHWGLVTPFALEEGDDLRPGPPAFHPKDEAYTVQAEALLRISANLTDRQKMIAEYWADGPSSAQPPGHWNLFAQFVSRRDRHGLDDDVRMFFAVNSALLDAGITSWECKRFYDYVRPFTALRFLFAGQLVEAWAGPGLGTQLIDGADWLPYQAAYVHHAAVRRIPVGPQHVQRGGGGGSPAIHGTRLVRDGGRAATRLLVHRTGADAGEAGRPFLADVLGRRRPGRALPSLRWHPLPRWRSRRSQPGPAGRCPGLAKGGRPVRSGQCEPAQNGSDDRTLRGRHRNSLALIVVVSAFRRTPGSG